MRSERVGTPKPGLALAGLVTLALACGGGGNGGGSPTAPPSPSVDRVEIEASTSRLLPLQAAGFTARAFDASGAPHAGTASWSTSNATVARVAADGTVTAVRPGGATITATIDGIQGSVDVTVLDGLDLLRAPFDGEFQIVNYMDHDIPREFIDANGVFVTHWGERDLLGQTDGHAGYDWALPIGEPVLAAADGTVTAVFGPGSTPTFFCPPLGRDVNDQREIQIEHETTTGARIVTIYVHLSRNDVAVGDRVVGGQQIGLSGNSGCSTDPHLHFAVFRDLPAGAGDLAPAQSRRVIIDPFGWTGTGADPWAEHPEGLPSTELWRAGQAPPLYRWFDYPTDPLNTTFGSPIVLTRIRYMGIDDESAPNNEFVQVERDPRFAAATVDLSGFVLLDAQGERFVFPAGTILADDPIRVFSGTGTDSTTELFWGRSAPVWDNDGDCADLERPDGTFQYRVSTGAC